MLSKVKKTFIILFLITIVTVFGILIYTSGRTFYSKEDEIGNTAGNIYNGGLFCEQEGIIYFSNDADDGSLYAMSSDCTKFRKVHSDKAVYINADEHYIYYLRANNTRENSKASILMFNNSGVYRIKQNGSNLKAISNKPAAYLTLKGNNLYFQKYDVEEGLHLYRNGIDASSERLLLKDAVVPAAILDGKLYYTGYSKDQNIHYMDLSGYNTKTYLEGNFAYPIFRDDYIYYMDISNNYKIYRMNHDGTEVTALVDERCSTYNITNSGKYLYYQVDNNANNRIARLNLETMEHETIQEGNFKQIHVTEFFVFFKDFKGDTTYILSADGVPRLGTFNPPVINED